MFVVLGPEPLHAPRRVPVSNGTIAKSSQRGKAGPYSTTKAKATANSPAQTPKTNTLAPGCPGPGGLAGR